MIIKIEFDTESKKCYVNAGGSVLDDVQEVHIYKNYNYDGEYEDNTHTISIHTTDEMDDSIKKHITLVANDKKTVMKNIAEAIFGEI